MKDEAKGKIAYVVLFAIVELSIILPFIIFGLLVNQEMMIVNEKIKAYYVADDVDEVLNYIDNLEKENSRLKDKIKDLEEWLEAMASMYENEYKDVNASEHYKCMLHKLKENQAIIKNIKINNKIII